MIKIFYTLLVAPSAQATMIRDEDDSTFCVQVLLQAVTGVTTL
jgi:hypothetical protein